MASEIDRIIPPEILDDELHSLIERLARTERVKHVLEIGSAAGGGSTTAFVSGLAANPNQPFLYCMELSKTRFEALSKTYADRAFVQCFNASSVSLEEFPSEEEVARFYHRVKTTLNQYPLAQVLGWLRQDFAYVRESGAPQGGIEIVKREVGVSRFDMVLIDGSEFTGSAELNHVVGAKIILLDDTNAFKCHEARRRLLADPNYELIADNQRLRNGYSAFRRRDQVRAAASAAPQDLPVHFFTIVLNGEPFIRHHINVLRALPFRWHWHIVEGVADLVGDTAWSVAGGGRIDGSLHDHGLSNDGTSDYLDEVAAAANPGLVTLYRKPPGQFWNGKKEMVSAPLANIQERCLLWQLDADELWTARQITDVRAAFAADPERTAAYFWCDYFVGPAALISTRYNYAQNPAQEWLRVWRYRPGDRWAAHEPPTLVRRGKGGRDLDVARIAPLLHDETEALGAVFQHCAYVTAEQLRFKEVYYGYAGASECWRAMQRAVDAGGPVLLRDFFQWVHDDTLVDSAARLGVDPMAEFSQADGAWRFKPEPIPRKQRRESRAPDAPRIVVDGVFFQHNQTSGIARVWRSLLREWRATGFADNIVVLDRAGTVPRVPGIRTRSVPAWDDRRTGGDALMLQQVCDDEGADLFVSSYYTSPIETPAIFVAHDMIPEKFRIDLNEQSWREKRHAISHAARFICVSQSTADDLLKLFPAINAEHLSVIANAADEMFAPASAEAVQAFRVKHRLLRPYLLLVGERLGLGGYKNGEMLFRAFQRWPRRDAFEVVCVGGGERIETELQAIAPDAAIRRLCLDDAELALAYSGAAALVYPSRYEGFGLPVLEAMACGCPVVAARASSLPEVGGEAALYFDPREEESLLAAMDLAVAEADRARHAALGRMQAKRFSWRQTAASHARVLSEAVAALRSGEIAPPSPVWRALREEQRANQAQLINAMATGSPGAARSGALASVLARSPLRGPLFAVRGVLLRLLPSWAIPAARRGWRFVMGIRA